MAGSSFAISMTNVDNLAYTGPVFVGTPMQGNNLTQFVYDTGSGYLTIPTTQCIACRPGFKYNPSNSATYSTSASYSETKSLVYGSASLTGYMGSDTVCLNPANANSCVNNFSFFLITKESGLQGVNGILGLSPAANGNGPSFMQALHAQGGIDEFKVSFQLNTLNTQNVLSNYADFGTPVLSRYIGD